MGIFASETTPIESAVKAATDESLISEDWGKIIAVCNEVSSNPSKNGPDAVKVLRTRLATPNGNVQLFSLTLINALAQNCGPILQREIASQPMIAVLLQLGLSRTTHRSVIARLIEILSQLTDQFSNDPSLRQIQFVYEQVKAAHPIPSGANPPVQVNQSQQRTNVQSEEDDEDLRRALELSLRDMGSSGPTAATVASQPEPAKPRHFVRALYDFTASEEGELTFKTGDLIEVQDRVYKEWWKGILNGAEGIFPANYVEEADTVGEIASQTDRVDASSSTNGAIGATTSPGTPAAASGVAAAPDGAPSDADENYIFSQLPAVERLLSILTAANQTRDSSVIANEDVQQLYHQISSIRPRLVQLIDEYAMKKQELVELNQKLFQARRGYDQLMADAAAGRHRQQQPAVQQAHPSSTIHGAVPYTATAQTNSSSQTPTSPPAGTQAYGYSPTQQYPPAQYPAQYPPAGTQYPPAQQYTAQTSFPPVGYPPPSTVSPVSSHPPQYQHATQDSPYGNGVTPNVPHAY